MCLYITFKSHTYWYDGTIQISQRKSSVIFKIRHFFSILSHFQRFLTLSCPFSCRMYRCINSSIHTKLFISSIFDANLSNSSFERLVKLKVCIDEKSLNLLSKLPNLILKFLESTSQVNLSVEGKMN